MILEIQFEYAELVLLFSFALMEVSPVSIRPLHLLSGSERSCPPEWTSDRQTGDHIHLLSRAELLSWIQKSMQEELHHTVLQNILPQGETVGGNITPNDDIPGLKTTSS